MNAQKDLGQTFKPSLPILLSIFKVYFPSKMLMSILFVLIKLSRKRNSRWLKFSDCARVIAPFDSGLQRIEMLRPISNYLIHKGKGFKRSSFYNIDNHASNDSLIFLDIGQRIYYSASDWAS